MRKLTVLATALCVLMISGAAEAARTYRVKLKSTPAGASIYLEGKGDEALGKTPHTIRLPKGQHTLILKRDGYKSVTRTVLIRGTSAFSFSLEKKPEPATFSIEPAPGSQVTGASVKVNGKEVGKVPVTVALLQGRYLVEVAKEGFKTWEQWIDVKEAEKRSIVVSLMADAPDTGNLLVSSNVTGAMVFVDGVKRDAAPALVEKLTVGVHMVEVRAEGYETARKEVTVEKEKTAKLTVELTVDKAAVAATTGTIQVLAEPKGVEVLVDGASQGDAPVKVAELAEGTHIVEGKKAGFETAELKVEIKKGEFKTVKLTLKEKAVPASSGKLQVSSNVKGANVALDGKDVGKTPLLMDKVVPGPHVIRIYGEGYQELYKTVAVNAGQTTEVMADLKATGATPAKPGADKPAGDKAQDKKAEVKQKVEDKKAAATAGTEEKQEAASDEAADAEDDEPVSTLGLSSFGAQLVGKGNFTADFGFGYPYIFEGRLTTGLYSRGFFGVDVGVDFRTFGLHNEIGIHSNFRVVNYEPVAVSVNVDMGGGGGPKDRENFYFKMGLNVSLWFKRIVTFTGRAYLDVSVDDLCDGSDVELVNLTDETEVCRWPEDLTPDQKQQLDGWVGAGKVPAQLQDDEFRSNLRGTFTKARFMLAAILEFPVHEMINIWAMVEGAPGQGGDRGRWAYRKLFSSFMPSDDPAIYGRLGATIKF